MKLFTIFECDFCSHTNETNIFDPSTIIRETWAEISLEISFTLFLPFPQLVSFSSFCAFVVISIRKRLTRGNNRGPADNQSFYYENSQLEEIKILEHSSTLGMIGEIFQQKLFIMKKSPAI